ncbi:unnamed protein product [Paramecium primaurelia]|uniref:Uncharacterized protein n=1 Tax=Paramecium primaurelia TaxID=5886 RepID=A0A8S1N4K3_PARPR|nr:unnamed protein product [Paramecium primaurelia]
MSGIQYINGSLSIIQQPTLCQENSVVERGLSLVQSLVQKIDLQDEEGLFHSFQRDLKVLAVIFCRMCLIFWSRSFLMLQNLIEIILANMSRKRFCILLQSFFYKLKRVHK